MLLGRGEDTSRDRSGEIPEVCEGLEILQLLRKIPRATKLDQIGEQRASTALNNRLLCCASFLGYIPRPDVQRHPLNSAVLLFAVILALLSLSSVVGQSKLSTLMSDADFNVREKIQA